MSLAICAIFKNEAKYLQEWIEFHRLVGAERFYLYQNNSEDDWRRVLQPYMESGIVEVVDWPIAAPCQMQAYAHFIERHKGEPRWVAFIDCDEFLFSPSDATIMDALARVSSPDWGAVGVNWMSFGASGHENQTEGLVIERFTLRPSDHFAPNRHIKSIVRIDRMESVGPDPHHFAVRGGTFGEYGREVFGPLSAIPSHTWLRINHYHTKSREEFLLRIALGRADGTPQRSPDEFDGYQAQDIDDRAIWRFLPALKQRIADGRSEDAADVPDRDPPYAAFRRIYVPPSLPLPREFAGYRDYHKGETILVCGCGSSLSQIVAPERFTTIGVNDMGRLFHPDYLVVINPRNQFAGDRFRYVETSQAKVVFTQLDLGISHLNTIRFRLGQRGGADLSDTGSLPYTRNSPYVALCLALHMGAKRIGLIGVDFTEHHFFGATGRHPLTGELNQIDCEYNALANTCRQLGVEVYNLSANSRITAFPKMSPEDFARSSLAPADVVAAARGSKVFFVNYRFLSCGEVFSDGLHNAAQDLRVTSESAYWDDGQLPAKVNRFGPDLLFVIHGRKYSERWKSSLGHVPSAVWLLDEPYEVDDTSRFSPMFGAVLVNDPSTLHRHKNAHYLPVCYDPGVYHYRPGPRRHEAGFIGGGNPVREVMLQELARRGLLSYVVGGPWRSPELQRICLSGNIPAAQAADLYRQTRIVVNVFRTVHHYNREQIRAVSMNPRIYEALACGSLVISERRPEIEQFCPEMPSFGGVDEMVSTMEGLLNNPARFESVRKACIRRLAGHTYAHRLHTALAVALGNRAAHPCAGRATPVTPAVAPLAAVPPAGLPAPMVPGWQAHENYVQAEEDGVIVFRTNGPPVPGSEVGLIGIEDQRELSLSFEVLTEPGALFIAKVHQQEQHNQSSNSYHLMCNGSSAYVARHHHIFKSFLMRTGDWEKVTIVYHQRTLSVKLNGNVECHVQDELLASGYCFLGIKSGTARVRKLMLSKPLPDEFPTRSSIPGPPRDVSYDSHGALQAQISIVTTVYDRIDCLDRCLRSVRALRFEKYEHIIVADAPPPAVLAQIRRLVEKYDDRRHRLRLAVLRSRANDWGITPAALGLSLAGGPYVCFLSDDNGYTPNHFEKLVSALEADPELGFVYSGCFYDGRLTLNAAPPAFGRIDLGQPLFRRELFQLHLGDTIPFSENAWDWKMIQRFIQNGVRWKHVSEPTFIFRLAKYPQLIPPALA